MTELQRRPIGSWYAVVLGDPAASQTGRFPSPDLGRACVCCDTQDAELSHFDPSSGPFVCEPIPFPLCGACRDHVRLNGKRELYIASAGFGGITLAVIGLFVHLIVQLVLIGVGTLLTAGAIAAFVIGRKKRRALCESGHFAGLELGGAPGFCSIRTMNHRVAAHLIDHHGPLVHRVR